ncbi:MAG: ankyrin repeat domain-containing protein [Treponema sp.]|jgi:ankyrin repeat protein|nr:ankyrin repeat domain-containing protein [Treponema sp.]
MKKSAFLHSITIILTGIFVLFIFSCKSAPAAEPAPIASVQEAGTDIWSLLSRGDERSRSYFLGEIDVNATDSQGRTPLHYAAENQDSQLAAFFLALGANPNALDNSRQSPLGISVGKNDTKTAEILVNGKADIHLQTGANTSAAALALSRGTSIFKALLTADTIQAVDNDGKTVLHLASIAGSIQGLKDILAISTAAALINKTDKSNKNALDYAFERKDSKTHIEIAEQLILSGGNSQSPVFAYFAPAVRSANYNIRRNDGLAPIHYAVMNNHSGLISFLLEKNIDINIKTSSGAAALHEAVRLGNLQVINIILGSGADVNITDAKGNSPLHIGAPLEVHREIINLLLSRGANPNLRDEHGETPLHISLILNRPLDVIQVLLGGGSDVKIRNIEGKTPLYIAVQEGRLNAIPALISHGSEIFAADNSGVTPFDIASRSGGNVFNLLVTQNTVNQRDSAGNTILHAAVRNQTSTDRLSLILDMRSPVNARNMTGDTALHFAVRSNNKETGEFLISRGADIFSLNSSDQSPLFLALSANNGMREWIINPATIRARDGMGNSMLHYAAQWNLISAIPVIIRNGIQANETNATGETPLFMAVKTNSTSAIRTLIENRANINARDTHGNSVLHAAVRWNTLNAGTALISHGIDVNVFSLNGNTPLHDAVSLGMTDLENLLIGQKADLEVRNVEGNTPFMEAAKAGNLSSMQRLISGGADPNTRNTRGDTPLHIAVSTERTDMVNFLLSSRSSIHARNTSNRTPFQISLGVSPAMVSALLTNDRLNTSDDFGNSPLHIALQERVPVNYIQTILGRGTRINSVDSNGKTPLRLAVDTEQWGSAKLLADSGADPFLPAVDNKNPAEISFSKGENCIKALFSGRAINAKDSSENTILHLAARYGTPENINVLLSLGANKSIKNISSEMPYEIALRWNRRDNAELLKVN